MVGTHSKEGRMAMTGARTPSAIVPKEDQDGVDMMPQDDTPAEGRDLGSAAGLNAPDRAGKAQVARDDQPRGSGERQQRKQHAKHLPKGHNGGPRHQQHKQRKAPPRAAPEQLGAAASTATWPERKECRPARQESARGWARRRLAAQRKQGMFRWCRPPRAAPEQQEASADLGDTAGTEEREGPALSDLGQRAPEVDFKKWLAALLGKEGIKSCQRSRMVAGILMGWSPRTSRRPSWKAACPQ